MKRKTLYNFNSVQLTFNQCVFNRIQYRTEHKLYSTRLDNSTDNSTDYSTDNSTETRLTIYFWQLDSSVWQFDWQFSFTIQLTIRPYNSALQFVLSISLTIRLYNSAYNSYFRFRLTNSYLQIQLTIGITIILVDQNGWNDPSVRAATLPWSKAGVSCRGLRWRTLAGSDARMGRVTRGKDSFWPFTITTLYSACSTDKLRRTGE